MGIAFEIVTILIGIEHLGIMVLEMFASPAKQAKAFDMEESFLRQKAARTSMANQGIYNGMLGVSLIASQFIFLGMTAIMVGRSCWVIWRLNRYKENLAIPIYSSSNWADFIALNN